MTTRHTEGLLKKGKERKRLTQQLQDALVNIADQITSSVPIGTSVRVADRTYETFKVTSNLDTEYYLGIYAKYPEVGECEHQLAFCDYVGVGGSYYLHNDFNCKIDVAQRKDWLHFANNLPAIVVAFEVEEDKIIDTLQDAFKKLREMSGSN